MIERPFTKGDGSHNGHLLMTEANVTIETPNGKKKYEAGTMFHILASPQKLPAGAAVEEVVASREVGYGDVMVHWAKYSKDSMTSENEATLRRKIAKAEYRRWLLRGVVIGATGGSALGILELLFSLLRSG